MKWHYLHIDSEEEMWMSGWKLYIYGRTLEQADKLSRLLESTVVEYNLTTKVVTKQVVQRNTKKDIAWSAMVIYLKPFTDSSCSHNVNGSTDVNRLIDDITVKLESYPYGGKIPGTRAITPKIHCRYDLYKPVEAHKGVNYDEYYLLYRGEGGEYNVDGNTDILINLHKKKFS